MSTRLVSVVTGTASGIGKATAARLLHRGANVICGDRDAAKGKEVVKELNETVARHGGGKAIFVETDITKYAAVENLYKTGNEEFGNIHSVFANAGVLDPPHPFHKAQVGVQQSVIDVNVSGTFNSARAGLPYLLSTAKAMEKGGERYDPESPTPLSDGVWRPSLLLTSSISSGLCGSRLRLVPLYGPTKAFVDHLCRSLSAAYSDVFIATLNPFIVQTEMFTNALEGFSSSSPSASTSLNLSLSQFLMLNPGGKAVEADEIAEVVESLMSGSIKVHGYASGDSIAVAPEGKTFHMEALYKTIYEKPEA